MKRLFAIILICVCLPVSVTARGDGSASYSCEVIPSKLPSGCVCIDMLLLMEQSDENYTEYNALNGKKSGILQMSEIVKYNDNGFQSYTFHMKSAKSRMTPYAEKQGRICVEFLADETGYDVCAMSGVDKFGEKYKKAKFAYLDEIGNILAVTNEIDIWNGTGYMDIYITLSGEVAICEMDGNIETAEIGVVVIMFGICVAILVAVLTILLIAMYRKNR